MKWKSFTIVWRKSPVPPESTHLRFWVQIEPSSYQRRTRSWCTKQAIFYQQLPQFHVNESRDVHSNSGENSNSYPSTIQLQNTRIWLNFQRKSIRRVGQYWLVNFLPSFSWFGWKNNYCRTLRMPPSSIFTNGKGTNGHTIITADSPYFQFWARS